ncbi:MAG: Dna2/Cas4 domain-containing protein [Chloroflexota bacterium]|nr:MAG: Dna2/Cas4 domain-containing protein [Chloroflexota bacterium]
MPYLIGSLIILGVILFWLSSRQRAAAGLPAGRVIFSDHEQWGEVPAPLYDPTFNLTGKPDYLVENERGIIPVEVKSTRMKTAPYDSHIYQLAAYCLLVDKSFGIRPPYGILNYPNKEIAIDYTNYLEQNLIEIIREIHLQERRKNVDRSHHSLERCRTCGFRTTCDQALT